MRAEVSSHNGSISTSGWGEGAFERKSCSLARSPNRLVSMRGLSKSNATRCGLLASALALCLAGAATHAFAAGTFITASGVKVPMPDIVALDCGEMRNVLAEIDASGYRGAARYPIDEADAPLLDYENRLARTHFQRCASVKRGTVHESAFAGGYDE